jgi:fermentation-respiration switch protein FrsA (DUF1100 family)
MARGRSGKPGAPSPIRRIVRVCLLGLGGGYVGVILVLLALENRLVYHPTPASEGWEAPPRASFQDVELRTPAGVKVHAWWCPVEGASGAVLYCHGNAGNLSHRGLSILAMQKELGESVLIFDYPGYGKSEGTPGEAGCYAAADAAYDWLRQVAKISGERITLFGGSLGGGVAVDLASRQPHRALLLAKTFTSMPDVGQAMHPWLPVRWLMRNRYDNLAKIKQCKQPVVITHGTADGLIPFSQGERLFAAANEPKLFYRLDGEDHNSPLPVDFFRAARRFIESAEATVPRSTGN